MVWFTHYPACKSFWNVFGVLWTPVQLQLDQWPVLRRSEWVIQNCASFPATCIVVNMCNVPQLIWDQTNIFSWIYLTPQYISSPPWKPTCSIPWHLPNHSPLPTGYHRPLSLSTKYHLWQANAGCYPILQPHANGCHVRYYKTNNKPHPCIAICIHCYYFIPLYDYIELNAAVDHALGPRSRARLSIIPLLQL